MKWIAIALLVFIGVTAQDAKFSEKQIAAWNAVQEELTTCVAFWQFAKACAPEGAKDEELQQADRVIKHMTELAVTVV